MDLEKVLEEKLKIKYEKHNNSYLQLVSNWFAYIILSNEKYIVDHSLDPTWDYSGRLLKAEEPFDLNDYVTFGDFVETEYTEDSTASFTSRCGLYHTTYDEPLEYLTNEWLMSLLEPVIKDLIKNDNEYLMEWIAIEKKNIISSSEDIDGIIDEIFDDDLIGDFILTSSLELLESLKPIHPIFLFNRGKVEALKTIESERVKQKKMREDYRINSKKAQLLWNKIIKMYQEKYNEVMPHRIEKPLYDQKVKSLLIELHRNGTDVKEIQYIGKHINHYFSNSVRGLISGFKS